MFFVAESLSGWLTLLVFTLSDAILRSHRLNFLISIFTQLILTTQRRWYLNSSKLCTIYLRNDRCLTLLESHLLSLPIWNVSLALLLWAQIAWLWVDWDLGNEGLVLELGSALVLTLVYDVLVAVSGWWTLGTGTVLRDARSYGAACVIQFRNLHLGHPVGALALLSSIDTVAHSTLCLSSLGPDTDTSSSIHNSFVEVKPVYSWVRILLLRRL